MKKLYTKATRLLYLVILLAIISTAIVTDVMAQVSIVTQHGDIKRTGWNNKERALTVSNVDKNTFGIAYSVSVDDQTYAQPLVVSNLTINGSQHNVVFVATVNNTVYAVDADNGTVYWTKNYTPTGQRPPTNKDMKGACGGNYNDFSGNMGIVGTPVIDSVSRTMYFVARSTNGSIYQQFLHAIDISTGDEKSGSPVEIKATYNGNGDGNVGGVISFDPQRQNQRAGLVLSQGIVYITYAAHCDWGPYHGWILGYDVSTLARKIVYNTTPEGYNGGIWMSAGAPAVDESGNLYVSVGNGSIGYGGNLSDVRNRGESALKLTPTATSLTVSSFFTPKNYQDLENADLDFGVTQVMLIPNTTLALTGCKDGNIYLLNRDNLGGINTSSNQVAQTISIGSGKTLRSSLAYYQGPSKEFFYTWSENAALKAFPFNRSTSRFDESGVVIGSAQGPSGANGTLLSVSSNGAQSGTGILWASHSTNGDANQSVRLGILRAFDANDVTKEIWNSNQLPADNIGNYAKFVCPTIANGKVYMATFSNKLIVYGGHPPTNFCAGSTNLALNKPAVSSSNENTTTLPSLAFDGNSTTRWASAQGVDPQWIYVDLGSSFDVCRVVLRWESALAKNYQIQVSNDPSNTSSWTTIKTITDNNATLNDVYPTGTGRTGRYVRIYGTVRGTSYGYSLFEMEVYGTSASTCASPVNLTINNITRTGATLQWDAVAGAGSYKVQYKTVAASTFTTATVTSNSLALTTLDCGLDYIFNVQTLCGASSSSVSADRGFSTLVCDASCGFLPTRWFTQDVGSIKITGAACYSNSIFRLKASGKDIGGNADGFRFAYKTFTGDGTVTAKIDSLDTVNPWNKAGVMFRESLDSTSRNALIALSSGNGATFQYRSATSGVTNATSVSNIRAPYYVKVVKRGTSYAGYISTDSVVWTKVGSAVNLGFGGSQIYAGIALTSHDNTKLSKTVFSHVPIIFSSDTTVNLGSIAVTGVSVTPTTATLNTGSTQQLTATVSPSNASNKNVTWSSSNTAVASVNTSGLVTAVAAGTATITATTQSGSKTATSAITVNTSTAGDGLKGEYYNIKDLSGSIALTRTDATINFDFGSGPYASGQPSDNFSVRWTGEVLPKYTETYIFETEADDGVRLWVNGVQVVNNWVDQGPTKVSGTINLTAGTKYSIKMEYYENGGGSVARLRWSSPSQVYEIIPQSQLYSSTTVAVTGVSVSPPTATITVGGTQQLTPTVAPATNKNVTWSSSNTSVATVNTTGLVTAVASGTATITVTTQDGGKTATSAITVNASTAGDGLKGEYYNIKDLSGSIALTRTDATINFDFGTGSYASGQPVDNFSVRWTGQVQPKYTETYTFETEADDGVRLWVNGVQVVNDWVDQGTTKVSGTISLTAGTKYSIKMEYYENGGGAIARLRWSSPSQVYEIIPQSQLYSSSTTVAVTGVSVTPTTATLNVGATQQLTPTVTPSTATNKNVTYSSSNTAVATVNPSGLITAVATGTATITVTTQDGGKTATSAITVNTSTVSVTGVSVTPTTASINVSATQQLTATVSPSNATNKNVTWSSSNTAVATVSTSGLVTAVAAGTANITATTQDGGKTAISAITVTASTGTWGPSTRYQAENGFNSGVSVSSANAGFTGTGYVTGLTTVNSETKFDKGVSAVTPTKMDIRYANGTSSNITNLALYIGSTQKIQDLVLTPTGSWSTWGTVTVIFNHEPNWGSNVIIKGTANAATSASIDCSDIAVGTVGRIGTLEESIQTSQPVNVYPNPSTGIIGISANPEYKISSVQITNSTGKMLLNKSGDNSNTVEIDISHLTNDVYILRVNHNRGTMIRKVVLIK